MRDRKAYWREYQRNRRQRAAEALAAATEVELPDISGEALRVFTKDFAAACVAQGISDHKHWRKKAQLKARMLKARGIGPTKLVADLRQAFWRRSKSRAQAAGIAFSIAPADIPLPERCEILGLKLDYSVVGIKATPNAPSLDRINNSRGYVKGNIQVISHRANKLKNDSSLEELILLGKWAETKCN